MRFFITILYYEYCKLYLFYFISSNRDLTPADRGLVSGIAQFVICTRILLICLLMDSDFLFITTHTHKQIGAQELQQSPPPPSFYSFYFFIHLLIHSHYFQPLPPLFSVFLIMLFAFVYHRRHTRKRVYGTCRDPSPVALFFFFFFFFYVCVCANARCFCVPQETHSEESVRYVPGSLAAVLAGAGPFAWAGMTPATFLRGGRFQTPWGVGTWHAKAGFDGVVVATFFGIAHELRLGSRECGRLLSVRSSDGDRVPVSFTFEAECPGR